MTTRRALFGLAAAGAVAPMLPKNQAAIDALREKVFGLAKTKTEGGVIDYDVMRVRYSGYATLVNRL